MIGKKSTASRRDVSNTPITIFMIALLLSTTYIVPMAHAMTLIEILILISAFVARLDTSLPPYLQLDGVTNFTGDTISFAFVSNTTCQNCTYICNAEQLAAYFNLTTPGNTTIPPTDPLNPFPTNLFDGACVLDNSSCTAIVGCANPTPTPTPTPTPSPTPTPTPSPCNPAPYDCTPGDTPCCGQQNGPCKTACGTECTSAEAHTACIKACIARFNECVRKADGHGH